MTAGGHKHDGLGPFQHLDPLRKVGFLVQKEQDVHVVLAHHVEQLRDQAGVDAGFHRRAQGVKLQQNLGQNADGQRLGRADPQLPRGLAVVADKGLGFLGNFQEFHGVGDEPRPVFGQLDPLSDPLKELCAQLLLQLLDLYRHRRLGIAQLLSRPGKALQFGHPQEGSYRSQFHLLHLSYKFE